MTVTVGCCRVPCSVFRQVVIVFVRDAVCEGRSPQRADSHSIQLTLTFPSQSSPLPFLSVLLHRLAALSSQPMEVSVMVTQLVVTLGLAVDNNVFARLFSISQPLNPSINTSSSGSSTPSTHLGIRGSGTISPLYPGDNLGSRGLREWESILRMSQEVALFEEYLRMTKSRLGTTPKDEVAETLMTQLCVDTNFKQLLEA